MTLEGRPARIYAERHEHHNLGNLFGLADKQAAFTTVLSALLFTVACNTSAMTLSWQDTSENEDGFRIYRIANNHKTFIAEVGPNVTQYVDKNAPRGACYIVTAFNAAGESSTSNSACQSK